MVRYFIALILLTASFHLRAQVPLLYKEVAKARQVPEAILYTLAFGESKIQLQSGTIRPWPWTLNVKGQPYYYATRTEACQALKRKLQHTELIDIGLTQLNWYWQKSHFSSPCEVFEPIVNLNHAAKILLEGKAKYGSWVKAAGYFHRPAGGLPARRYEATFATHLEQLRRATL
ncbi:lytic transglycosylase [Vibrio sp. MACH09]|uniref:hypothetical protein n=1 Tax=Vibrio sp. MACH09 TaxID=3025122 RepID=UPI0027951215|nr:hypothetical protein [Vibrio sp. MACH09]GLO64054.1 lytic transglycosylase [Vibrio sp. MACH09]